MATTWRRKSELRDSRTSRKRRLKSVSAIGERVKLPLISDLLTEDKPSEEMRKAREFALSTWSQCFSDFIYIMRDRHYPNDRERDKFTEAVKADLANPEYKLWTDM